MSVSSPTWRWPAELDERGPPEDPAIVLAGTAYLGSAPIQIVAIRIDPAGGRVPAYAPGVPQSVYADTGFDETLRVLLDEMEYVSSELDELLGQCEPSSVALPSGHYRFYAFPASLKTSPSG